MSLPSPLHDLDCYKYEALLLPYRHIQAYTAFAAITWSLQRAFNSTTDQKDAYTKIEAAMQKAVLRYSKYSDASKVIKVYYAPGVPTVEASSSGDLRIGSIRSHMTEFTRLAICWV